MSRAVVTIIAVVLLLLVLACGGASGGATVIPAVATRLPVSTTTEPQTTPTDEAAATLAPVPTRATNSVGVPPLDKDNCPPNYLVKGNIGNNGKIYHAPGDRSYAQTDPERCFATSADAEAAGFHAAQAP